MAQKIIFLILIVIGSIVWTGQIWFAGINEVNLEMDEVVWILDTDHYSQWVAGNQSFFTVSSVLSSWEKGWLNPHFRVLDQPFFGKAVFGWYLHRLQLLNTWEANKAEELYIRFTDFNLPTNQAPFQSQEILSNSVVKAIESVRWLNAVVGYLSIFLFAIVTGWILRSSLAYLSILFLSTYHPLTAHYLRLAMTNTWEIGWSLAAVGALYAAFQISKEKEKWVSWLLLLLAGVCTGFAIDTKLNTLVLLGIPLFLLLGTSFSVFASLKKYIFYLASVGMTLYGIDPTIRVQPLKGMWALLSFRFMQQQVFSMLPNAIPFYQTPLFLLKVIYDTTSWWQTLIFFILTLGGIYDLNKKRAEWILLLCLYLVLVNLVYLTAGFERYALSSLFVGLYLAGVGSSLLEEKITRFIRERKTNAE